VGYQEKEDDPGGPLLQLPQYINIGLGASHWAPIHASEDHGSTQRSCIISTRQGHHQGVQKHKKLVLKVYALPFRTRSRPRQSQLPAFVKQEIWVGSMRKGHVLVWGAQYLIKHVLLFSS